jgi:hypothetical protein
MPEDVVVSLVRWSFQSQRSSARTAWRGVTAGGRGVTRRRYSFDLDWPGNRVVVRGQRFDVDLDRLADHR